ncbi:MAG: hypothetical protein ABIQ32_00235 [Sphingomicrobium sp.]
MRRPEQAGEQHKRKVEKPGEQQSFAVHGEQRFQSWIAELRAGRNLVGRAGPIPTDGAPKLLRGCKVNGGQSTILLTGTGRPARFKPDPGNTKQSRHRPLADVDVVNAVERNRPVVPVEIAAVDQNLVRAELISEAPPMHDDPDQRQSGKATGHPQDPLRFSGYDSVGAAGKEGPHALCFTHQCAEH